MVGLKGRAMRGSGLQGSVDFLWACPLARSASDRASMTALPPPSRPRRLGPAGMVPHADFQGEGMNAIPLGPRATPREGRAPTSGRPKPVTGTRRPRQRRESVAAGGCEGALGARPWSRVDLTPLVFLSRFHRRLFGDRRSWVLASRVKASPQSSPGPFALLRAAACGLAPPASTQDLLMSHGDGEND